jgi:hypothetical protein
MATPKETFDLELAKLFNQIGPSFWEPTPAGLALEFALPGPIGRDFDNAPTSYWTVVLTPRGGGVYELWTTYPGHPVLQ